KAQINQYAKKNNIAAQVVLQNYMFERFLAGLAVSDYCNKFVIKGGVLIAATANYRGSTELMKNPQKIIEQILTNNDMRDLWQKYSVKFAYAKGISFETVMKAVWEVVEILL
ncbi:MAG: hypothetical protein RR531_12315, partial [Longicatena sp.]